jgi:hypothetical protein
MRLVSPYFPRRGADIGVDQVKQLKAHDYVVM